MSKITFQYIWVEKYRCFDNAEFNFSAKHQFHYDKDTNVLTHEDHSEDSDYREQLYGVEDLSTSWILHEQHNETLSGNGRLVIKDNDIPEWLVELKKKLTEEAI